MNIRRKIELKKLEVKKWRLIDIFADRLVIIAAIIMTGLIAITIMK